MCFRRSANCAHCATERVSVVYGTCLVESRNAFELKPLVRELREERIESWSRHLPGILRPKQHCAESDRQRDAAAPR